MLLSTGGREVYSPYAAMYNAPESTIDPNGTVGERMELPGSRLPMVTPMPFLSRSMQSFALGDMQGYLAADPDFNSMDMADMFDAIVAAALARGQGSSESTGASRPFIGIGNFVCNLGSPGGGDGGSSSAGDDPQNIKEGAVFGGVAGLISVGEGAEVGGVGWGMWQSMQVTGVTAASTVGVFAMTVGGVFLPTDAGVGSTQEDYGIGRYGVLGQYYLGNSSYPGPWSTTYRPSSQDPINREFNNFDPEKMPDWKGAVGWLLRAGFLYKMYDEYKSHINNMPTPSAADNTRVNPQIRPKLPWER